METTNLLGFRSWSSLSKADLYPWTFVTLTFAKIIICLLGLLSIWSSINDINSTERYHRGLAVMYLVCNCVKAWFVNPSQMLWIIISDSLVGCLTQPNFVWRMIATVSTAAATSCKGFKSGHAIGEQHETNVCFIIFFGSWFVYCFRRRGFITDLADRTCKLGPICEALDQDEDSPEGRTLSKGQRTFEGRSGGEEDYFEGNEWQEHQSYIHTEVVALKRRHVTPSLHFSGLGPKELRPQAYLGRGKTGTVYMARDRNRAKVAVKRVPAAIGEGEVDILKSIEHPNVVKLLDSSFDADDAYLVMEYCAEGSLANWLDCGPLQDEQARVVANHLIKGLVYLHSVGITHGDLKPENTLVSNGYVKICDFGGSTCLHMNSLKTMPVFTPAFAAPEVKYQGIYLNCSTRKSDIWSFGATVLKLITLQEVKLIPEAPSMFLRADAQKEQKQRQWWQKGDEPRAIFPQGLSTKAEHFLRPCLSMNPCFRPSAHALAKSVFVKEVEGKTLISSRLMYFEKSESRRTSYPRRPQEPVRYGLISDILRLIQQLKAEYQGLGERLPFWVQERMHLFEGTFTNDAQMERDFIQYITNYSTEVLMSMAVVQAVAWFILNLVTLRIQSQPLHVLAETTLDSTLSWIASNSWSMQTKADLVNWMCRGFVLVTRILFPPLDEVSAFTVLYFMATTVFSTLCPSITEFLLMAMVVMFRQVFWVLFNTASTPETSDIPVQRTEEALNIFIAFLLHCFVVWGWRREQRRSFLKSKQVW